ncbi:MAG: diadenylate cyclase CdaA [Solobacterium sp.]|nr:diadenylate cyclase CdaA [Solobacterium sp.]
MFLDIFIMWLVLYYSLKLVRSNTKTVQIFKGILLFIIIDAISKFLGLKTLTYLADIFINWGFLAIIIIFQPEIRSVLEQLGKTNLFSRITALTGNEKENLVDQIVTATMLLSQDQTGALISIEQSHSLDDFIATGTKLNSDVTAELLTSIFVTSTPLHDGAVIIQGDKIACASAYFPPTNLELPSRFGARHRAAIGISEITDAVTVIVSEETGAISVTEGGKIYAVNRKQLRDYLLRVICGEETEVRTSGRRKLNDESARQIIIDDTAEIRAQQEKKEKKTGETGVLSKLAIKRQEQKENEKIEVEEVVPAIDRNNDRKITELEEEARDIKLPKKKERPAPSYPDNSPAKRFEEEKKQREEEETRRKLTEEQAKAEAARQLAEVEKKRAEEEAARKAILEAQQKDVIEEELKQPRRMSAEEVRAAREASMKRLSGKKEETPEAPAPETETPEQSSNTLNVILDEEKMDEASRQFDTSKIDITNLMHMNDELDRISQMIDSMDEFNSSESKGGDK